MKELRSKDYKGIVNYICQKENCIAEDLHNVIKNLSMYQIKKMADNKKDSDGLHVKKFEKLQVIEQTICLYPYLDAQQEFTVGDSSGLFLLRFSNKSWIYFWKFYNDDNKDIDTIGISNTKGWHAFETISEQEAKYLSVPKIGIFEAYMNSNRYLEYREIKKSEIPSNDVIHPTYNDVYNDILEHFSIEKNELYYKRFNKPRIRKILLKGETGTGKTSMNIKLAQEFGKTHSFVHVFNLRTLFAHLNRTKDADFPSIIVFEDCEQALKDVDSDLLNRLTGINQPYVKEGAYVIFTTNYPDQIDHRVTHNPDRINDSFYAGPLTGKYAYQCAKYYLNDLFEINESHTRIFENLTGGEIVMIRAAAESLAFHNSKIDLEAIVEQRGNIISGLNEIDKMPNRTNTRYENSLGFKNEQPF